MLTPLTLERCWRHSVFGLCVRASVIMTVRMFRDCPERENGRIALFRGVVCRANVMHLTCKMKYAPDEPKPFIQISRFNEDRGKEPGSDRK